VACGAVGREVQFNLQVKLPILAQVMRACRRLAFGVGMARTRSSEAVGIRSLVVFVAFFVPVSVYMFFLCLRVFYPLCNKVYKTRRHRKHRKNAKLQKTLSHKKTKKRTQKMRFLYCFFLDCVLYRFLYMFFLYYTCFIYFIT